MIPSTFFDDIFYSGNIGFTWTQRNSGLTDFFIEGLAVIGSTFIAITKDGIFKSLNKGSNWTLVNPNTLFGEHTKSGTRICWSKNRNIMVAADSGVTWNVLCPSPEEKVITDLNLMTQICLTLIVLICINKSLVAVPDQKYIVVPTILL